MGEAGSCRLLEPIGRVVVGDGDDLQAALGCELHERRGRERPVGAVRVRVEIDPAHGRAMVS